MTDGPERSNDDITLPEGATVMELPPFQPSVELALEVARLGVSDEAIEALGGEEALERVHEERAADADPSATDATNGNPSPDQ